VPFLLVGLKTDLRKDDAVIRDLKNKGMSMVTPEDGLKFAQRVGAAKYLECSALTMEGGCG